MGWVQLSVFCRGVEDSQIESFYSIECNKDKAEQAKENLAEYIKDNIHLLWGTILPHTELNIEHIVELFPSIETSSQARYWAEVDISNCRICPNVLSYLPDRIDFLLLDGGEFTTLQEFNLLLPRCTAYIALDDIFTEKCIKVHNTLLSMSSDWKEIYFSKGRNGFSIFERAGV